MGKKTLVMFVDFAKAYDLVPHAALLRKLSAMGIRGKLLRLLTAMYKGPRLSVKTPSGSQSESTPLEVGVRQGCPSSPILFNLFINDLVDELEQEGGVDIPGMKNTEISALLFADDLVMLADSEEKLHMMVQRLEGWCKQWEMRVNAAKCGVMEIGVQRSVENLIIRVGRILCRWSRHTHTSVVTSPMTWTSTRWQSTEPRSEQPVLRNCVPLSRTARFR